ncbi:hypothetical protein IWW38_000868 [Coemansia aciculifera]|uniref:Uncharacterized protein n=1 Tax=Coemansia aciculifera TaxID=417176 RepID=A0ACC1M7Y4_9FUNG|nr:hypothetical protein IWW38_000868 [Coemansia aciculifera]
MSSSLVLLRRAANDNELLPDGSHVHPTNVPDIQKEVYLWIGVIDLFIFTVSTVLFIYRGHNTLDINAHAVMLTSIGSFTILVVNTCFLFQFVWPGSFPCFIILWCAYPGVMLWMSCTMARALRLYVLSYRNMQKLKERNRPGQLTAAHLYGTGIVKDTDSDLGDAESTYNANNAHMATAADQAAAPNNNAQRPALTFWQRRRAVLRSWWNREKMLLTERRLVWYTLIATLFAAIICAIIQALTKDLSIVPMRYSKCPVGVWEYFPLYSLTAFYCLILTPIIVYHIWPIKDAFGIRHDILLNNLFTFVCIAMFMVQTNQGFGGKDPFWDSFLWCALLFNMSQFTSVIIPLVRSYRQSDIFVWSDSSGRNASKELFYRVLNHPEMFRLLKVYSAANFCTEVTLFLEEYQVLKANAVRFYNMDEPDFKVDETGATKLHTTGGDDDDDGDYDDNNNNAWTSAAAAANNNSYRHPYAVAGVGASSHSPEIMVVNPVVHSEKDAMRLHLNGKQLGDLESNPDTIMTVGEDGCSMSDADFGDDKAPAIGTRSALRIHTGPTAATTASAGAIPPKSSKTDAKGKGRARFGAFWGIFQKTKSRDNGTSGEASSGNNNTGDDDAECNGGNGLVKPSNAAILAIGGAAIGDLPQRRNSRGEDVMVVSSIPPFTPVRYTIMPTLMQTPAGLHRKVNINAFKVLPFTLRGDYYGFYSTFIAQGATLQINIDGRIAETITRLVHSQQYTIDMMDEAHSEVLQLLYDNIFKKFVRVHHRDLINII